MKKNNLKDTVKNLYLFLRRTVLKPMFHIKWENINNKNIGKCCYIKNYVRCLVYGNGKTESVININDNVEVCEYTKIICVKGKLTIGSNCTIGDSNTINLFDDITIGDDVITADRVSFITNEHNYDNINEPIRVQGGKSKPISVGDGSWIGINSTILGGNYRKEFCCWSKFSCKRCISGLLCNSWLPG